MKRVLAISLLSMGCHLCAADKACSNPECPHAQRAALAALSASAQTKIPTMDAWNPGGQAKPKAPSTPVPSLWHVVARAHRDAGARFSSDPLLR